MWYGSDIRETKNWVKDDSEIPVSRDKITSEELEASADSILSDPKS